MNQLYAYCRRCECYQLQVSFTGGNRCTCGETNPPTFALDVPQTPTVKWPIQVGLNG